MAKSVNPRASWRVQKVFRIPPEEYEILSRIVDAKIEHYENDAVIRLIRDYGEDLLRNGKPKPGKVKLRGSMQPRETWADIPEGGEETAAPISPKSKKAVKKPPEKTEKVKYRVLTPGED